ncbi:segregation and condensation protein A [Garciella nitratireducens]|uniref:segregation and condensation protein A n=1 Tax=Garciella nitratireducens TaxID=218205 RepID=UPI001BD3D3D7|nr:segregation/condensation protein A [Garciella nitratireducens]
MSYKITLDSFQGPLDLLLHLIEKNKVDIYDIPISEITNQYMEYLNQWRKLNLDVASEFLVMAATLLEMKSKLLLPNDKIEEQLMIEEADPRQELIKKLLEYKKYKKISLYFKKRGEKEEKIIYKDPEYFPQFNVQKTDIQLDIDLLYKTYKKILSKRNLLKNKKNFHEIKKDIYTVENKMKEIINIVNKLSFVKFSTLFYQSNSKNELITIFLAILELIKRKKVHIRQKYLFDDFYILQIKEE